MRLISIAATSLLMTVGCSALPPIVSADALDSVQRRVIKVSERVKPSVVHIEAAVRQNTRRNLVTGSGFISKAASRYNPIAGKKPATHKRIKAITRVQKTEKSKCSASPLHTPKIMPLRER